MKIETKNKRETNSKDKDVIFQARLRAHDQLQADLALILFSEELGAIYFYHVSVESRR